MVARVGIPLIGEGTDPTAYRYSRAAIAIAVVGAEAKAASQCGGFAECYRHGVGTTIVIGDDDVVAASGQSGGGTGGLVARVAVPLEK